MQSLGSPPTFQAILGYIGEWLLRSAAAVLAMLAVMRFIFQPWLDSYILASTKRKRSEFKEWVEDDVMKHSLEELAESCKLAEINKDKIEALETIQKLQAVEMSNIKGDFNALRTDLVNKINFIRNDIKDVPRVVDAMERIERAIERISEGMEGMQKMMFTMRGEWDGIQRRKTDKD